MLNVRSNIYNFIKLEIFKIKNFIKLIFKIRNFIKLKFFKIKNFTPPLLWINICFQI